MMVCFMFFCCCFFKHIFRFYIFCVIILSLENILESYVMIIFVLVLVFSYNPYQAASIKKNISSRHIQTTKAQVSITKARLFKYIDILPSKLKVFR